MKRRFVDLAVCGVLLGILQALIETALLAVLHRDLLLAPYRFFPTHAWDAFTKLYFAAADRVALPLLLQDFAGPGFASKLALAPELVAINIAVAMLLAVVLAPVAGVFFIGRDRGLSGVGRDTGQREASRVIVLLAGVSLLIHAVVWVAAFQPPESVTAFKLVRAVVRDLLQGGAVQAAAVLAVAALATRAVVTVRATSVATAAAGLVLALAAAGGTGDAAARTETPRPEPAPSPVAGYNVVLISIDSLRADHLGAYGYTRATSPFLDSLARDGVLFRNNASTTSWTLPAHMSLLTGRSLLGHGVVGDDRSLPASVGTVAEAFSGGGYRTHAIVSAPYVHSRYGFARGFDDYDDRTIFFATNEESYRSVTAPRLVDAAEQFLDGAAGKPFFLFLHFWDVHYDYAPGAPYDAMFDPDYRGAVDGNNFYFDPKIHKDMDRRDLEHLLALYDGEIRLVDDQIARLSAALAKRGLAERTIFAITSDHGDEFFEHGNKGHHRTLYEEVLSVPFILHVAGRTPSQGVVQRETSIVDIGPTLLGLAGLAAPGGAEGRDLSGLYTGAALPAEGAVRAELYRTGTRNVQAAEIERRRKVIHHFQKRGAEIFDLSTDPGEQNRLAPAGSVGLPLLASLRDWIDGRWQRFDKRLRHEGLTPVVLDEKARDQLRSLGYLN